MLESKITQSSNTPQFTIVLAIRDSDKELRFMKKSLPSAIKLEPNEIIIGLDKPASLRIKNQAIKIAKKFEFKKIHFLEIEKSPEWNFQLANIIWNAYSIAKNDHILSFDVDSILTKKVLLGLDYIGKNNVAVVSFTKRLRTKTPQELIRYIFYRIRVKRSDYVFSGVYWIYRPYYFDSVPLQKYKSIFNGVDTIMCDEILSKNKYKIITRKEIGVKCLDVQNEDLPWRQFQLGIWIAAHQNKSTKEYYTRMISMRKKYLEKRKKESFEKAKNKLRLLARWLRLCLPTIRLYFAEKYLSSRLIENNPQLFVLIKSLVYMHPYLFRGYQWARKHPNDIAVKVAKSMNQTEWGLLGSKYIIQRNWKQKGTGFVEALHN